MNKVVHPCNGIEYSYKNEKMVIFIYSWKSSRTHS